MAIDPIDDGPHLFTGRNSPRVSPGISMPAGLDGGGLPIGIQFYGNFCHEYLLLHVAAQIEPARTEWFGANRRSTLPERTKHGSQR